MKNNKPHILFVDDDPLLLESVKVTFRKDFIVKTCTSPFAALGLLKEGKRYAVIVSDMQMPGMDGIDFLRQAAAIDHDAARIMLTGYADLETAMAAVNDGKVSHFLTKPCSPANLKEALDTCVVSYAEKTATTLDMPQSPAALDRFIGDSAAVLKLKSMLHRLGEVDVTVLFTGESGTGKSLAAEVLHSISERKNKPFVRVNCPSLSEGVFEAELFGSVRGAYTGSVNDSMGRFMAADGGSILLDEIGDVPLAMQAKLLHVIEHKELERVGDHKTVKTNVRIMAATNVNLVEQVENGSFRKDLYYRLNVMHLNLPPLRERRQDIPLLAEAFLTQLSNRHDKGELQLTDDALNMLCSYSWPGNVRELKHALERGATLCSDGIIRTDDLPNDLMSNEVSPRQHSTPVSEKATLLNALERAGWNKSRAARILGISRSSLYRKMKESGVSPDESMN